MSKSNNFRHISDIRAPCAATSLVPGQITLILLDFAEFADFLPNLPIFAEFAVFFAVFPDPF